MKREDRRQAIINLLIENHAVDLDHLAERFAVSKMTIHRDLDALEHAGVLRKMRGGATIDTGTQFESDFRFRETQDNAAKLQMARTALELIEPGMTVMINDGSTAAVLGNLLREKRPLTIITNNAVIIDNLKGENSINLIALGGVYSPKFNAYFGLLTEEALSRLSADIAFISAPAVNGRLVYHMDESVVRTKRAMTSSSVRSCLLINHRRFGRPALHVMADLADFDAIITDKSPAEEFVAPLEQAGIKLTIAEE
ncbi:DeoR family transcriptional regulator [Falsochrobactrum shanghaiense]|uniref:DeoR family transcriptional regulator n=1 Tax=Falsochrobactrum shanghaiense TaxID=2201899 RepID=A0A316J718_9HYPH|nr:DeoR/GlpR family DNA-binding transcription regulator [Falsochrobactrum shanghaiense]PWL17494.1 DeoR family transcriptional regulator [Falsochrobactrum shanghaiense]